MKKKERTLTGFALMTFRSDVFTSVSTANSYLRFNLKKCKSVVNLPTKSFARLIERVRICPIRINFFQLFSSYFCL